METGSEPASGETIDERPKRTRQPPKRIVSFADDLFDHEEFKSEEGENYLPSSPSHRFESQQSQSPQQRRGRGRPRGRKGVMSVNSLFFSLCFCLCSLTRGLSLDRIVQREGVFLGSLGHPLKPTS